jgi:hypothetical protein
MQVRFWPAITRRQEPPSPLPRHPALAADDAAPGLVLATHKPDSITRMSTDRDLFWDGCLNVRDLGGHPTKDGGVTPTRAAYMLFLERFKPNVGAAVRAVAEAPEGGVVIHCVGGKDRTGLLTALLLHLTGVPTEDIALDYALSEERLRPRHDAWLAAAETDAERKRLERITRTPPQVITGVFDELERRYGSVEDYLRTAGVGDRELARARSRLRG